MFYSFFPFGSALDVTRFTYDHSVLLHLYEGHWDALYFFIVKRAMVKVCEFVSG